MNDTNKTTYATLTTYQPTSGGQHHDQTAANGQLHYMTNSQPTNPANQTQYITSGVYNGGPNQSATINSLQLPQIQQLNAYSQQLLVNMDDNSPKHNGDDMNKSHLMSPLLLLSSVSTFNTKTDCGYSNPNTDMASGMYDSQAKCYKSPLDMDYSGQHHAVESSMAASAVNHIINGMVDFGSTTSNSSQHHPLVNVSSNVLKRQSAHLRQSHACTNSNGNNTSMSSDASSSSSSSSSASSSSSSSSSSPQMEEINTKELAQRISSELKRYSIPQAVFAQRVLCRSQGTLSDLLRNPKPWLKLKSGRETFRRMWKWLQEPESQRMNALRLASKEMEDCLKGWLTLESVFLGGGGWWLQVRLTNDSLSISFEAQRRPGRQ
jgi:hypothetical protein